MNNIYIRNARRDDVEAILTMCDHSRSVMRHNGNMTQWANGYPSQQQIEEDIRLGHGFCITEPGPKPSSGDGETAGGRPVGYFAFIKGADPTYAHIEGGKWLDDTTPYGTIHRLAAAEGAHGVAEACLEWCAAQVPCLRADTHADNAIMQHILVGHGFSYCGIIYVADGTPRHAYQRMLFPQVTPRLKAYVEAEILPRYEHFDAAHRPEHVATVMAQSMSLAAAYPELRADMVYAIAAYHDTGIVAGRELHHTVSGQIIRDDARLAEFFSPEEVEIMAQAAEDHRASSDHAPRSLYGRIVAEADRDIEPLTIVRRTVQYGLSHYPQLDTEAHWQRTLQHLHEKYDYGGYLKLYIPHSRNAAQLETLRHLIADKKRLREVFDTIFAEENNK